MLSNLLLATVIAGAPVIPLPEAATSIARLQAGGVQIYRCASTPASGPAWTLDHPIATLYRGDGTLFGTHGAGPSWTATDGSAIVADGDHPIARVVPTGGTSVPWLALRVLRHSGAGVLSDVRYVERYDTLGGIAPDASDCTAPTLGTLRAVHYSAVYEFFD